MASTPSMPRGSLADPPATAVVAAAGSERAMRLAGTFLVSAAMFYFEVSTVRTVNFVVGPSFIYVCIALAMLGLTAAGSLLSLFDLRNARVERTLFWLCLAIAAVTIGCQFPIAEGKQALNDILAEAGRTSGRNGVVAAIASNSLGLAVRTGAYLTLPYFLFGALLSFLFARSGAGSYGTLYAADLIGAALGCLAAVLAMEYMGYAASVTAPAVLAALAAAAFALPSERRLAAGGAVAAALLAALPLSERYAGAVEPAADAHHLVRDYARERPVAEVWHGWNSYTRVAAIEDAAAGHAILSLGNGDGMAWLLPFEPAGSTRRHPPTLPALLLDPPRDALVLLAGAGADLLSLRQGGADRVTGVEMNRLLVDGAASLARYRLGDMLATDGVRLRVAEARGFLERTNRLYDQILVSWSGATVAYHSGMLSGTTQYLFTYEGLRAVLDRLTPGGYAVILQVNKINTLAALRRWLDERGIADAGRTAVVLYAPDDPDNNWRWAWDNNPLLIKPAGWTPDEVARLKTAAAEAGYRIAYAPGEPPTKGYAVYGRLLAAPAVEPVLAELQAETGRRFGVVTDDRPFYLDQFPTGRYLDWSFWSGDPDEGVWDLWFSFHRVRVLFVTLMSGAGLLLILAPLFMDGGPPRSLSSASHLAYFSCLGLGFMLYEIAIMQGASLLFDHPGIGIATVLAGVVLFLGLGSLLSGRGGFLSARVTALVIVAYALALYAGLGDLLRALVAWPLVAKVVALMVVIAPGGLLMGRLFPRRLALAAGEHRNLVPWAWGLNGAMTLVASGIAPLIGQAAGISTLLLAAAGVYAATLLLPPFGLAEDRALGPTTPALRD